MFDCIFDIFISDSEDHSPTSRLAYIGPHSYTRSSVDQGNKNGEANGGHSIAPKTISANAASASP